MAEITGLDTRKAKRFGRVNIKKRIFNESNALVIESDIEYCVIKDSI